MLEKIENKRKRGRRRPLNFNRKLSHVSLFLLLFSSVSMNRFNLSSASSFRPPAKMGSGGGNMIEMVLALFVLADIWVLCVETMLRFTLLSLLLLLFWLLLMLAEKLGNIVSWAVAVAQAVEWSHPTLEIRGSNPVLGNFLTINCIKTVLKRQN